MACRAIVINAINAPQKISFGREPALKEAGKGDRRGALAEELVG
jgi:hypothetical protein